jgi:two-component system sensor histidine kinase and response regulator WspE
MEAEAQTVLLNDGLLTLERDPQNAESLEVLMRAAHSLKGAARIVQLNAAERVAHVMEDCFVAAQEGRVRLASKHIEVLLHGVDMLTRIAQVAETAEVDELATLHTELDTLVAAITAIVTPGAAPPPAVFPRQEVPPPPQAPPAPEALSTASPAETAPAQDEPAPVQNMPVPAQTRSVLASDESALAQTKPVPASAESAVAPPTPRDSADKGRAVRVTAENLNRLMGLAGESLVESRWLEPFAGSLRQLKRSQVELSDVLERLRESLAELDMPERAEEHLTIARRMLDECRHTLSDRLTELELFARRSENLSDRLYREAIASRMRPFDDGVQGFPRMVRDIARKLGKEVKLEILGRATEVDRDILERLEAPVSHLLRNAIDHGVEPPEERLAVGKDAEGTIRLEAGHRGGMLSITVSDDGQGVDLEELRKKIVSKQLTTAEMAESLTEAELMDFLFLPAFSTKEQVTEISGRGVGLDVVHDMVQEVSGTVRAISEPGRGIHFLLQLPLTLSVLRTLLVDIAGEPYAFPLARIDRAFMLPKDDIDIVADRQYFTMDGQHIGLVLAHQVLEVQEPTAQADALSVIVVSDRLNCYGLVVDRFLGESDLVVQPLDPRLGKVPDVSAAALMENGSPILIIDVEDMVRSVDNLLFGRRLRKVGRAASEIMAAPRKRILVVDDSITVREVERQLLENHGYEVEVAVDGMDGWNAVRVGHYDLVISDVDMPRMNGIELVGQIKSSPQLQSLPVMIVSYKGSEEDRNRGLEAGANYYLTKSSFHDETLLHAVVDLIGEA